MGFNLNQLAGALFQSATMMPATALRIGNQEAQAVQAGQDPVAALPGALLTGVSQESAAMQTAFRDVFTPSAACLGGRVREGGRRIHARLGATNDPALAAAQAHVERDVEKLTQATACETRTTSGGLDVVDTTARPTAAQQKAINAAFAQYERDEKRLSALLRKDEPQGAPIHAW